MVLHVRVPEAEGGGWSGVTTEHLPLLRYQEKDARRGKGINDHRTPAERKGDYSGALIARNQSDNTLQLMGRGRDHHDLGNEEGKSDENFQTEES